MRVRFERAAADVESKAQPINAYTDFKKAA
jgi:hypothetical protein